MSKLPVGSLVLVPDRPYPVIETVVGLGPVSIASKVGEPGDLEQQVLSCPGLAGNLGEEGCVVP